MIEIKLHNPIANKANTWMYRWDGYEGVFSLEFVQSLFEQHPEEKNFKFNIHCPGGEVEEGLAIYDCLRTSGRNIHMNIEGSCHSMAVTLLLAAPKENRSANLNCRALIHKVYGMASGSADELERAASDAREAQNSLLDIYADRTNLDRATLETLMNEEKERTAQELLEWGFISKINSYNTNFKTRKCMAKNLKERANDFMAAIRNFIGTATNFEFVDAEGKTLFTTEAEDDTLEVGMAASPDGTFTILDGRTVVIADGVITEIQEPDQESEEVTTLLTENENLRNQLAEAAAIIREFQKKTRSNYQPGHRVAPTNGRAGNKGELSSVERKQAIRDAIRGKREN